MLVLLLLIASTLIITTVIAAGFILYGIFSIMLIFDKDLIRADGAGKVLTRVRKGFNYIAIGLFLSGLLFVGYGGLSDLVDRYEQGALKERICDVREVRE